MSDLRAGDALSCRVVFGLPDQRIQDLLPEVYRIHATHCAVQSHAGELRGIIRVQDALRISPYRILADLVPSSPCPVIQRQRPLADVTNLCLEQHVDAVGVLGDDGLPFGVVTNESLLEASLKSEKTRASQAEQRFRKIFENAVEGIFQCDLEGNLLTANPAFFRIAGYGSMQSFSHEGLVLSDFFVEPDTYNSWRAELNEFGIVQASVVKWRTTEGSEKWIELSGRTTHGNTDLEEWIEGVALDITERVDLESQLRQAQKLSTIGQLAGGIAHDFNNLLTVIRMNTDVLLDTSFEDAEVSECISQLAAATDSAAELTKQLLNFSRDDVVDKQQLSVNDAVANILRLVTRVLGETITIDLGAGIDLPGIYADQGMLSQVVLNLIVNAQDSMPEEGGHIQITTALTTVINPDAGVGSAGQEYICIDVRDTGEGIDPGDLPHIFEPFFSTRASGKGTGLGLATVHNIVRQHRGWIDVDSKPGRGTSFCIFLPAVRHRLCGDAGPDKPGPVRADRHGRVLLVEDMDDVRHLMSRALSQLGLDVVAVSTGTGALEEWRTSEHGFDLLFTDCILPDGITGPELATRLTGDSPELNIIFTSGYSAAELDLDLAGVPNSRFVQKPFDIGSLARVVDEMLAGA